MAISKEVDELWLGQIKEIVGGLQYGNVQIVVHNGKVVQIDITERKRFDAAVPLNTPKK